MDNAVGDTPEQPALDAGPAVGADHNHVDTRLANHEVYRGWDRAKPDGCICVDPLLLEQRGYFIKVSLPLTASIAHFLGITGDGQQSHLRIEGSAEKLGSR
jgi:hypothetical protein